MERLSQLHELCETEHNMDVYLLPQCCGLTEVVMLEMQCHMCKCCMFPLLVLFVTINMRYGSRV